MSTPLPLPEPFKRIARRARANSTINRPVTRAIKTLRPLLPKGVNRWLHDHFPRVGRASALLPGGGRLVVFSAEPEYFLNQIYYGDWTAGETDIVLWQRVARHAQLVVDIGAHIGHFTLVAAAANPKAQVLAFEPLPRIASALRANVAAMKLDNVRISEVALSNNTGTADFFSVPDGMPSSSSLSKDFMDGGDHSTVKTSVNLAKLDDIAPSTSGITLMKIDTESTEDNVIRGGASFLNAAKPVIFIEVLSTLDADRRIDAALREIGFSCRRYLLTGKGPVARDRIIADSKWRNYLLVPTSGPAGELIQSMLGSIN